jgi:hypothetical protein
MFELRPEWSYPEIREILSLGARRIICRAMPTIGSLKRKSVMVQLRNSKPFMATVTSTEQVGVWISAATDLMAVADVLC